MWTCDLNFCSCRITGIVRQVDCWSAVIIWSHQVLVTMITFLLLLLPPSLFSSYGSKQTPCKCLPKSYHKPKNKDHVSQIVDHAEFCAPDNLRYIRYIWDTIDLILLTYFSKPKDKDYLIQLRKKTTYWVLCFLKLIEWHDFRHG